MEKFKIRVETPERSKLIQEVLFAGGYKWQSGDTEIRHTEVEYLYLNYNSDKSVSFGGSEKGIYARWCHRA